MDYSPLAYPGLFGEMNVAQYCTTVDPSWLKISIIRMLLGLRKVSIQILNKEVSSFQGELVYTIYYYVVQVWDHQYLISVVSKGDVLITGESLQTGFTLCSTYQAYL